MSVAEPDVGSATRGPSTGPITGLHHVVMAAADTAEAERFYVEVLGLQALGDGWLQGPNAALRVVPAAIAADAPQPPWPVNVAGLVHICVQSADMPALRQRWLAGGGSAHSEPVDLGTGYRYCYARDPDGHVCELENVPPANAAGWAAWSGATTWLAHASLSVADIDRAVAFYSALLGRPAARSPLFQNNPRADRIAGLADVRFQMAWIEAGNQQIELIRYHQPATTHESPRRMPGARGWAELVFEVQDVAAALALAEQAGGRITASTEGRATDPEGNALRFIASTTLQAQGQAIAQMPDPQAMTRYAAAKRAAA